ncbi:helix-turn-helix domain-containing protein [Chitinophaga jiangningensis]|nr:helix-turn-helix transcriptional regulator [Chitinophaga jiangningensis]
MFKYTEQLIIFAFNADAARIAKGWTQAIFAYEVGVEPAYMNKILNARRQPGFDMIHRIAEALEVRAGDLLNNIPPEKELLHFKELLSEKHLRNQKRRNEEVGTGEHHQPKTAKAKPKKGFNSNK